MKNMIWDIAVKTTDFSETLKRIVESNPEFKESQTAYEKAMGQLRGNLKLYECIDEPVIAMVDIATRIAFEAGFNEGIRLIIGVLLGKEAMEA